MDQDETWLGGSLGSGHIVLDASMGTQVSLPKGAQPPFRPMSVVAKRLDG